MDVKDKTVVIYSESDYPGRRYAGRFVSGKLGRFGSDVMPPQFYARMKGAKGVIIIAPEDVENRWDLFREESGKGRASVDKLVAEGRPRGAAFPTITITKETADKLFQGESKGFIGRFYKSRRVCAE